MRAILQTLAVIAVVAHPIMSAAETISPAKVAAVKEAAAAFAELGQASRQTGKPPRQSEPRVRDLLDTILNLGSLPAAQPLPYSEATNVNEWKRAILGVGTVYLLAGTGLTDANQLGTDPTQLQRFFDNAVAFAPEVGRYYDAQLGMEKVFLALLNAHLAAHPEVREYPKFKSALPFLYSAAGTMLSGSIGILLPPGLSDDWRKERLPAIQALATHVTTVVSAEDAKTVHDIAIEVAQSLTDPALQAALRKVAADFRR